MQQGRNSKSLGQVIHDRRLQLGISKYSLAQLCGINRTTLLRIESGAIRRPDPTKLARLAKALDLPLAQLYRLAGHPLGRQLPSIQPYLRDRYRDFPPEAVDKLNRYFEQLRRDFGADPHGPADGEDERPDDQ